MTRILVPLLTLSLAGCTERAGAADPIPTLEGVRLAEVARGLESPTFLDAPAGDPRLFVLEQPGRIRIIQDGQLLPTPFLDLTDRVGAGGERGLLGLAFHPRFRENGLFFVNYTDRAGDTRVERYRATPEANRADPATARRILSVEQPYSNHNGGMIAFGPDGMLYVGMGDGGAGGDPMNHGQNAHTLLGALLRLDVDRGEPYAIPPGNPYADGARGRPEVWATGLRNPWRFAFDREAGLLYTADVGQNEWEEINVQPADRPGVNYGWNEMEGAHCYGRGGCDPEGLVRPALEYPHPEGCSVTGGYVYRGRAIPALAGHYLYGDLCGGWIRSLRYQDGRVRDERTLLEDAGRILSFGEDAAGEVYVLALRGGEGVVYRIESAKS